VLSPCAVVRASPDRRGVGEVEREDALEEESGARARVPRFAQELDPGREGFDSELVHPAAAATERVR
jgi:hypothetical protein